MMLSPLPTFLAFPPQALYSPAPASKPLAGPLASHPTFAPERLGPPTVGGRGRRLTGRTCSISARRHPVHGRRWLARWRHNKPTAWAEGRPDPGPGTMSVSDMAARVGKKG